MGSIYTVGQVNQYIKNMFSQDYLLHSISVRGEVSNCKYHSSGHIYFTLKDKLGVISCIMFAGNRRGLSFSLTEGMQVVVTGKVDVYERDGRYQLYASSIARDGMGQLYEKFIQLKEELEDMGLFAPEYKKPLPTAPKVIGVVTASTGAAIRDIISVAKGRDPYVQIILYPAIVQGDAAPASICRGIKLLEDKGVDVVIVGRGGGSLEDLWAFNDKDVAQAIFDCSVPIISAVGHETDTTIADFVADVRAETPTAGAALATADRLKQDELIGQYKAALDRNITRSLDTYRQNIANRQTVLTSKSPTNRIVSYRHRAMLLEEHLRDRMSDAIDDRRRRLALIAAGLDGISPVLKLTQGYSYTESDTGANVRSIKDVKVGKPVTIHVCDGIIEADVTATKPVNTGLSED